ncbi:uncharacterized protein VTP21DRAFT_11515 [Calcarisporiella thermophila]|uniref:uncharacterized protein n=1 Tax=Calcarisporiella thermophila TaxID=911321 RepID=UPI003741EAD3
MTRTGHQTPLELLDKKGFINVCAPMVRYSKLPFRELVRGYDVDLCYTPMILANAFKNSEFARQSEFSTNAHDSPLVVQFAASSPEDLAEAAELVAPYCGGVDLNCGCPQKWAIKEQIGAHLMSQPEKVRNMVRAVKGRVGDRINCSVKIRIHSNLKETAEFVRRAESAGVDYITVHGRTRQQKSSYPVNLEGIRFAKEIAQVPVIANGDVFSAEDAAHIRAMTGVDGVMAARGLLRNPALFAGFERTPWECVEKYVKLALSYGTNHFIFHHHLQFMLEESMSNTERKSFNTIATIPGVLDHLEKYYGLTI